MANLKSSEPLDREAVIQHIQAALPDMSIQRWGTAFSVGSHSLVGTWVAVNGKRINTAPMCHGTRGVFLAFLMLLTGFGIVLYAVIYVPRQQKLQARVDDILRTLPGVA